MTPLQLRVFDMVRDRITEVGFAPTLAEIAQEADISQSQVSSTIDALVRAGHLRRAAGRTRNLAVAGEVDLRAAGTDALRAELARRGFMLDALEEPRPIRGMPCTADHCTRLVTRGKLFCRDHWFALPQDVRDRIFRAFRQKDEDGYATAIGDAKDLLLDRESRHV